MSVWFYKTDKSGNRSRSLYSVGIPFLILIIILFSIVVFIRFKTKLVNQSVIEIKEKIYYVPDEQTKSLKIKEMGLTQMLNAIVDDSISARNKAIIIQKLAAFPSKKTTDVLIRVLDDESQIMKDHFTPEEDGGTWSLSFPPLNSVALETLNTITGNKFSSKEEARDWYSSQQD